MDSAEYSAKRSGASTPSNVVTYHAAHKRLAALWGSARLHPCVKCLKDAQDWAYDGTDPDELCTGGRRWSRYPEFYMPMCKSCHKMLDNEAGGRRQPCWCGATPHAKNLCARHYEKRKYNLRKLAKPGPGRLVRPKCSLCEQPHEAKGLCKRHYKKMLRDQQKAGTV